MIGSGIWIWGSSTLSGFEFFGITGMLGVNSLEGETRLVFLGVFGSGARVLLSSLGYCYVFREGGATTFILGFTVV